MRRGALMAALGDGADPLATAQAALTAAREAWRGDPRCAALLAGVVAYGSRTGADPLLDPASAIAAIEAFLDHLLPALAAQRLGHMPFRHGSDPSASSLLLAREGPAFLSLTVREPGCHAFRAVGFDRIERHELVLAGSARGRVVRRVVRRGDGVLRFEPCQLVQGSAIMLDSSDAALLVDEVDTRLVSLRLDRQPAAPSPVREYALEDGTLLHQSSGDPQDSSLELALAVLGRMGRRDAIAVMAEVALEEGASDHLRWQALRECLALDTAAGLAALVAVAGDRADRLCGPAAGLLDQLRMAHPTLAGFEPA